MAKRLTPTQIALNAARADVARLAALNKAQNETLTLARQANAVLTMLMARAAIVLRSGAELLDTRGLPASAQLYRLEADRLDPPPVSADCQGEGARHG